MISVGSKHDETIAQFPDPGFNKSQQLSLLLSRNTVLLRTFKPVPLQFSLFASLTVMSESTFYSLKAELPSGKTYDFADLKGKTVLIVNTASNWYVLPLNLIPKRVLPN